MRQLIKLGDQSDISDKKEGWGKDDVEGFGSKKHKHRAVIGQEGTCRGSEGKDKGVGPKLPGLWGLKETRAKTEHAFTLRKAFYMAVAASFHDQKSPSLLPPIKIFFQWFCPHMKSLKSWFCRPRMLALPTALYLISSCSFLGLNPNVTSQREVSDPPRWGPIPLRYTPDIFHQWQLSHL